MKSILKKFLLPMALMTGVMGTSAQSPRIVEFESPVLKVFLPPEPNGKAIVACPGGGYDHLASQNEGYNWAPFYNNLGFAYAVLEYRLPGGDKEIPLADVRAAFKILADSSSVWKIDPAQIGIMGSSAGGHLASSVATHPTDQCRPAFQILFYPVISLEESVTHAGTRRWFLGENPSPEDVAAWSSYNNVSSQSPRAFIALSSDDNGVKPLNSMLYYNAMVEAGVPVELHSYPTGGHGWGYRTRFKHHDEMLSQLTSWLKRL
ncbi:MAG: alpha/beta hydrolase [Clostridiales bacterium]|nr:alpha/beta hydrolase [Clostridiales bacterium]